ncbi:MAG: hypothetical protein R2877_01670 [Bdellovibrionota bacterium]
MMKQIRKYSVLLLLIPMMACAGKQVAMKHSSIRSVQKMRMGMVELTSHQFNPAQMYECMKNFPGSSVT